MSRYGAAIAVVGPGDADAPTAAAAEEIGAGLAEAGFVVMTGGLGGVMEAASRGARSRLGLTVGILPGSDASEANGWVEIPVATGLGQARNVVLVRSAKGIVAVGGGYGALSEIAFALRIERPVVGLGTWDITGVEAVTTPAEAVERITALTS